VLEKFLIEIKVYKAERGYNQDMKTTITHSSNTITTARMTPTNQILPKQQLRPPDPIKSAESPQEAWAT
jgi:hypothetical protein